MRVFSVRIYKHQPPPVKRIHVHLNGEKIFGIDYAATLEPQKKAYKKVENEPSRCRKLDLCFNPAEEYSVVKKRTLEDLNFVVHRSLDLGHSVPNPKTPSSPIEKPPLPLGPLHTPIQSMCHGGRTIEENFLRDCPDELWCIFQNPDKWDVAATATTESGRLRCKIALLQATEKKLRTYRDNPSTRAVQGYSNRLWKKKSDWHFLTKAYEGAIGEAFPVIGQKNGAMEMAGQWLASVVALREKFQHNLSELEQSLCDDDSNDSQLKYLDGVDSDWQPGDRGYEAYMAPRDRYGNLLCDDCSESDEDEPSSPVAHQKSGQSSPAKDDFDDRKRSRDPTFVDQTKKKRKKNG
jgi:hypothetical protein